MTRKPTTQNRAPLSCLSGQPALNVRLAASSKQDGDEWAWGRVRCSNSRSGNRGCTRLGGEAAPPLSGWLKKKWPSWSSSSVGIAAPLASRCAEPWMMRSRARFFIIGTLHRADSIQTRLASEKQVRAPSSLTSGAE